MAERKDSRLIPYDVAGAPVLDRPSTWPISRNGTARRTGAVRAQRLSAPTHKHRGPGPVPACSVADTQLASCEGVDCHIRERRQLQELHRAELGLPVSGGWSFGIYIASEGGSGVRARVAAWQTVHEVPVLPTLKWMTDNTELHEKAGQWVEDIQFELARQGVNEHPDLIVVDTLARNFVGGSESDPKDMGLFVEGCETIRKRLETAWWSFTTRAYQPIESAALRLFAIRASRCSRRCEPQDK